MISLFSNSHRRRQKDDRKSPDKSGGPDVRLGRARGHSILGSLSPPPGLAGERWGDSEAGRPLLSFKNFKALSRKVALSGIP